MKNMIAVIGSIWLTTMLTGCVSWLVLDGKPEIQEVKMAGDVDMKMMAMVDVKAKIGQCRAAPVDLGGGQKAIIATWGADFDVDPYVEMFFYPTDTLKMTLFTVEGEVLWQRDLGPAVVPGMWFCPVLPMDLDGDGVDEIWFVNNTDPQHPLGVSNYKLERIDARTGETTGQWRWPRTIRGESLSHTFRNFLIGGTVGGEPVLVSAQGTYEDMHLQGRRLDENGELQEIWFNHITAKEPGARGSHRCPVVDIDGDGNDELMWGERCIRMDNGKEMFCCDRDVYKGHSDVIQPVWLYDKQKWLIYTCRESDPKAQPRVATFDASGERIWGDVDHGHMDMGGVLRLPPDGRYVGIAIRIGKKVCGPDGRFHQDMTEFVYDVETGEKIDLGYSVYRVLGVDIDGDGYHELLRAMPDEPAEILDYKGNTLARFEGQPVMQCKFMNLPGEQVLTFTEDGKLRIWANTKAEDNQRAKERFSHPYYKPNSKLTSSGSNAWILGGI